MEFQTGDQVALYIVKETDLGFNVLIEESYEALLFSSEIFQPVHEGMQLTGYIKNIREDGKIDVSLRPQGFLNVIDKDCKTILTHLEKNDFLELTDKSTPEEIRFYLEMSKKAFKKAIGALYKRKRIVLKPDRIELVKAQKPN
ncbi:MAG: DNA-binding protein [Flavobacteriaceae bacterium]|nr:DNA-binding protein [Flavobacteriaceae bacterium]